MSYRNPLHLLSVVCLLVGPLAEIRSEPKAVGRNFAIVVGVANYESPILRSLPYAENDVRDLADQLQQIGFAKDDVVLMTAQEAAKRRKARFSPRAKNIRTELDLYLSLPRKGDTVVIALAGHGVQFRGDPEHYFCPIDADLKNKQNLIPMTALYGQLEKCRAGVKLMLVDACRNDPLTGNAPRSVADKVISKTRPKLPDPPGGVGAFFSCSRGEEAFESASLKHGVFFHFVLEGLRGKAANSKGDITIGGLTTYVSRKVPEFVVTELRSKQLPEFKGTINLGLALVGSRRVDATPTGDTKKGVGDITSGLAEVRKPKLIFAMDLAVRKAGQTTFVNARQFGIEIFHDPNSNKVVYISQTGCVAVLPSGAFISKQFRAPDSKNAMDLRVRKAGEQNFDDKTPKYGVEIFQEPTSKHIIFISETGSIAVVPNRPEVNFTGKNPEWLHAMILKARPGGKKEFDETCPTFGVEVFYDPNTNCLIYINEKGDLAVTPGKSVSPERVATPQWKHAVDLSIRLAGKAEFDEKALRTGIEVFEDPNADQVIAITDTGKLALTGSDSVNTNHVGKAPPWRYGLDLRVRKAGQPDIDKAQQFGLEVYSDKATGCLIYITQTGSISLVKE